MHQKDWYFTSADEKQKYGITIRNSSISQFAVRTNHELIFDNLTHLRFQNNNVTDDSFIVLYGADLAISNNAEVLLERNQAGGTFSPQSGGMILANTESHIHFYGNKTLHINANSVNTADVVLGGAISSGYIGYLCMHHNDMLHITNNSATGNTEAYGGAVFVSTESDAQLVANGIVLISGNHAEGPLTAADGAFYCEGNLLIAGNKSVILENNYENHDGAITLRSIDTSNYYLNKKLELSAPKGSSITIYDSIRVGVNTDVHLNADGTDLQSNNYTGGGDIVFSGAKTREHLEDILNRAATDTEITASRTSIIHNLTELHAGRLIIEDEAILQGNGLKILSGNNATVVLKNGHLDFTGHDVELQNGTTLTATGDSTLKAATLTFKSGSILALQLDAAMNQQHSFTIEGDVVWENGAVLSLQSNGSLKDGSMYALLSHTGITGTPEYWVESAITIEGETARFEDFSWQNGTLYYTVTFPDLAIATWSGAETRQWDKTGLNWTQGDFTYAYNDALPVVFSDIGCGTVNLIGDLSPQSVLVNNNEGKDYIWQASANGGKLTGEMKLVKQGGGALSILMANTYTGGTELSGGTLITRHAQALGTGDIQLLGGTMQASTPLHLGNNQKLIFAGGAAEGQISTSAGSVVELKQDSAYTGGTLTFNGGTIRLQHHHLDIDGHLALAGETQIDVQEYTSVGTYNLITYKELTGNPGLLTLLTNDSSLHYMVLAENSSLILHITGDVLKWNQQDGIWSEGSTDGWEAGAFTAESDVCFDTGGVATIMGNICAKSIRVSGTETTRFTGPGHLSGSTTLTKEDSGLLQIETDNDFTGKVHINGGTVVLLHPHALGHAEVELNQATLKSSVPIALNQKLTISGGLLDSAVSLSEAGQMHIRTTGTTGGPLLMNGGSLLLQENAKLAAAGGLSQIRGSMCLQRHSTINISGNLTLIGGNIYLAHGAVLSVSGSLTLAGNVDLELESGAFADGTVLISTQGPLTGSLDSLILHYDENLTKRSGEEYELAYENNNVVLRRIQDEPEPTPDITPPPAPIPAPKPEKKTHPDLSLANWGVALASHAFVETLHGSRQYTGELGNGVGRVWIAGMGGYLSLDEISIPEVYVSGAAFGVEFVYGTGNITGLAIGYTQGEGGSNGIATVRQTGTFGALYGSNPIYISKHQRDIITLHWSLAGGAADSEMKDDSAAVSPLCVQADAEICWQHTWGDSFSTRLFTGAQYLTVNGDSADEYQTNALRYLRAEVGGGINWAITDNLLLYTECSYINDIVRHNPTDSLNPGRAGLKACIGMQESLGDSWRLHAHYSFERVSYAMQHSCHVGIGYCF